jgi:hypothetical protein
MNAILFAQEILVVAGALLKQDLGHRERTMCVSMISCNHDTPASVGPLGASWGQLVELKDPLSRKASMELENPSP